MDEQIRKLSSASGQSLGLSRSGSGPQDGLGALPFGSGGLDALGKPFVNFNRSPSGSGESVRKKKQSARLLIGVAVARACAIPLFSFSPFALPADPCATPLSLRPPPPPQPLRLIA
jgi:hypothetical protein